MFPKKKRIRLKGEALRKLFQSVAERDEYCCHDCGSHLNIEIHHVEFKSQGGNDEESNMITLCRVCHGQRHGIKIKEYP